MASQEPWEGRICKTTLKIHEAWVHLIKIRADDKSTQGDNKLWHNCKVRVEWDASTVKSLDDRTTYTSLRNLERSDGWPNTWWLGGRVNHSYVSPDN